jgi:hypothetical protein
MRAGTYFRTGEASEHAAPQSSLETAAVGTSTIPTSPAPPLYAPRIEEVLGDSVPELAEQVDALGAAVLADALERFDGTLSTDQACAEISGQAGLRVDRATARLLADFGILHAMPTLGEAG